MVLEASWGCCESIIDGLGFRGSWHVTICILLHWNISGFGSFRRLLWIQYWWFGISRKLLWSHLLFFTIKYEWFRKLQAAAANPLLMVWNLQEVAVKPFTHYYKETLMVLDASGGCCESIIDGLESPGGCCEAIYALLQQILMVLESPGSCREAMIDGPDSPGCCCEAI